MNSRRSGRSRDVAPACVRSTAGCVVRRCAAPAAAIADTDDNQPGSYQTHPDALPASATRRKPRGFAAATCPAQTFKPFVLLLDALDLRHLLLQHAGADLAHFCAPLLPGLLQIMMKTLRFLPFGAVQPHLFVRQFKFKLAPDDAALAPDLNQLIEGDQVFMFSPLTSTPACSNRTRL